MKLQKLFGLLTALALVAGACGGSSGGSDGTSGGSEEAEASTSEAVSSGSDSGDSESTEANSDGDVETSGEPILLGLPVNQSGPVGVADHQDWVNGITLATEEINAAGGVLGRQLEMHIVDTDILSPEGTSAGMLAMADAEVDAILSPFMLIPQAAMEPAAAYGAPYLHGNTSQASVDLYSSDPDKYSNVFQIDAPEPWYGAGLIPFLTGLSDSGDWAPKNNKIHIVQGQIAYTQVISAATQEAIEASGGAWELAGITDIQSPVADWAPVIAELKASDAGVIMIDHWVAAELAAFSQAFAADPLEDSLVYLQYGPSQPEYLDLAGDAAEGFIWGTVIGTYADEQGTKFREDYKARFPGTMGLVYTGAGYDTVYLLAAAIEAAGSTDFDAVNTALEDTAYRGVAGFYSFTDSHAVAVYPDEVSDPEAGQAHLFFQVQDGEHRIISPEPYNETGFATPPWAG